MSCLDNDDEALKAHSCLIGQRDPEEGDGGRKWAVVHHAEGIQRCVEYVHGQLDVLGGAGGGFPPQWSGGCLFAVQFALLFSPSLGLSFPLFFPGISWSCSSSMRTFCLVLAHSFFLPPNLFFLFIFATSKRRPFSLYFPLTSSSSQVFGHRRQQLGHFMPTRIGTDDHRSEETPWKHLLVR